MQNLQWCGGEHGYIMYMIRQYLIPTVSFEECNAFRCERKRYFCSTVLFEYWEEVHGENELREWERELPKSLTIGRSIFDNWQNCMLFFKSFWQIVKEWPIDIQRLKKKHTLFHELSKMDLLIVKDWGKNRELSKIDLPIVKDCPILVLILATRSPRLIHHSNISYLNFR